MKSRTLSIFLAKEDRTKSGLLDDARSPRATSINVGGIAATLYTVSTPSHPPHWASFFSSAVDLEALALANASSSALLVLPVKGRLFAVAFGYGRHLIDPLAVEATFGLHVTLNVATDKIRSIAKKTFEGKILVGRSDHRSP